MRGKGVGQPEMGGKLRPVEARTEDPDRHARSFARHGLYGAGLGLAEVAQQLQHIGREVVGHVEIAPQRLRRAGVGARSAPEPEVDPVGIERGQRAEGFGHHQRRVVRQHDPARAHADARGVGGDMADQHRRCGRGDARHGMVLGKPEAAVAERLGVARQLGDLAQGGGDRGAFGHRGKIEDGIGDHGRFLCPCAGSDGPRAGRGACSAAGSTGRDLSPVRI